MQFTQRAERLLNLVLFLLNSPQAQSAEDIRAQTHLYRRCQSEVSFKRTFRRDLHTLREGGVPIEVDTEARYKIQPKAYYLPILQFSESELEALTLACRAVPALVPPLREKAESALRKLAFDHWEGLGRAEKTAAKPESQMPLPNGSFDTQAQAMMTMLAATVHKRTLRIHYQAGASGEITTRCVDPYGILFSGGEWYLVGYCHLRREVRTFKVVRIQALEITDTGSRGSNSCVRKGFDLSVYARTPRWRHKTNGHSFSAKVWLDREAWHRVRNTGVFQGTVEERPDGCFLTVEVGNAPAFASAILELGAHADLREPEWLRSDIVTALGQMAEADR